MFTRNLVVSAVVPAALAVLSGLSSSPASAAQPCVFDKYRPVSAAPYRARESFGYGAYSSLKGAQLYIPAQAGLTKEWLALSIERALAGSESCNPDVKPVQVSVTSAGAGFWVQLIAHDAKQGEALLQWAKSIVEQHTTRHAANVAK